jgi:hypothetical protein
MSNSFGHDQGELKCETMAKNEIGLTVDYIFPIWFLPSTYTYRQAREHMYLLYSRIEEQLHLP